MRSDADEFRFHFIGLGQLIEAVGDGVGDEKNKQGYADHYQGDEFRLIGEAVGDQIRAQHRRDVDDTQNKENKTRALPDAQIIFAALAEKI